MKRSIEILKSFFETNEKPTEQQFADFIDSFVHKDELAQYISQAVEAIQIPQDITELSDVNGLLKDALVFPNLEMLSESAVGKLAAFREDGQVVTYDITTENGKDYADFTPIGKIEAIDAATIQVSRTRIQWFDFDNRYGDPTIGEVYEGLRVSGGKEGAVRVLPDNSFGKCLGRALCIEGGPNQATYRILVELDVLQGRIENQYAEPGYVEPGYVE